MKDDQLELGSGLAMHVNVWRWNSITHHIKHVKLMAVLKTKSAFVCNISRVDIMSARRKTAFYRLSLTC